MSPLSAQSGNAPSVSSTTPYDVDENLLSTFIGSDAGKKYSGVYKPGSTYAQVGDRVISSYQNADVTDLMNAARAYQQSDNQTANNWANYAKLVGANMGGQGDATITDGAAIGQREQILGTLANAGRNPTTPTQGLGTMGTMPVGTNKRIPL